MWFFSTKCSEINTWKPELFQIGKPSTYKEIIGLDCFGKQKRCVKVKVGNHFYKGAKVNQKRPVKLNFTAKVTVISLPLNSTWTKIQMAIEPKCTNLENFIYCCQLYLDMNAKVWNENLYNREDNNK